MADLEQLTCDVCGAIYTERLEPLTFRARCLCPRCRPAKSAVPRVTIETVIEPCRQHAGLALEREKVRMFEQRMTAAARDIQDAMLYAFLGCGPRDVTPKPGKPEALPTIERKGPGS